MDLAVAKRINVLVFIMANIIIDIEPLYGFVSYTVLYKICGFMFLSAIALYIYKAKNI
ncbi:MAG: hypothetical protein ABH952_05115 [Candidatus Omnitrophota bacterium]